MAADRPLNAGRLRSGHRKALIGVAALCALAVWWWSMAHHRANTSPLEVAKAQHAAGAKFVDEAQCGSCHAAQRAAWSGSHHAQALARAEPSTVLGDFADRRFAQAASSSRFHRREGAHWIDAEGPGGIRQDFRVRYTLGIAPLQQYLVELPGGRMQAFTVAWDVERRRWFDLYPQQRIDFRDDLHWSRPAQNWNYMCAECHSSDLHKNYDAASGSYRTTFAQVNVGCQACHGPGSLHVAWARTVKAPRSRPATAREMALPVALDERDATAQVEMCARCHSRRTSFWADYRHGGRLMDTHLPALLEADLYYADGQMQGEVYEYGSFLQSRMHEKGVRCSDCHEPHSGKTRASGNALCVTCHNPDRPGARDSIDTRDLRRKDYDSPAHHFHRAGQPGSRCVDCHMPSRIYMGIDVRRDHSLRIPRPDLSVKLGTPNACNRCHTNRTAQWAATAASKWYGSSHAEPHYAEALWAGRNDRPGAAAALASLARDPSRPPIARATALQLLRNYPGAIAQSAFRDELSHSDPLLRRTALQGFDLEDPEHRLGPLRPLLDDPVRAVRMEAARLLAPLAGTHLGAPFDLALQEYLAAQQENADRPEAHVNLGNVYAALSQPERAAAAYRQSIVLDPRFVPAYVALASLQRTQGAQAQAAATLHDALRLSPNDAALRHELGLALVRQQRPAEALTELARAHQLAPDHVRYAYVYGVALHDAGRAREALAVLKAALQRHPADRDLLTALAAYCRESGDAPSARLYDERLHRMEEGGEG